MKRAPNEKECRALTLSRRRPSTTSSSNEAARPPQPVTARDRGSQKVERRDNRKKRHRQGRDNFYRDRCSRLALPRRSQILPARPYGAVAALNRIAFTLHK